MLVRLAMNLTMTVIPFYLNTIIKVPEPSPTNGVSTTIALVPLVSFTASAVFSLFFYNKLITYFGNRLKPLFIGAVVITAGSLPFTFMVESFGQYLIYLCVAVQGIGLAILLNTATSIISDVIGDDKKSSAFVFGVYSFFDKMSSGILLFIITNFLI